MSEFWWWPSSSFSFAGPGFVVGWSRLYPPDALVSREWCRYAAATVTVSIKATMTTTATRAMAGRIEEGVRNVGVDD